MCIIKLHLKLRYKQSRGVKLWIHVKLKQAFYMRWMNNGIVCLGAHWVSTYILLRDIHMLSFKFNDERKYLYCTRFLAVYACQMFKYLSHFLSFFVSRYALGMSHERDYRTQISVLMCENELLFGAWNHKGWNVSI